MSGPRYKARVPRAEAVARSSAGNHRAAILVIAPMTNGCPTASPTWERKTMVKFAAKRPRVRPKIAVKTGADPDRLRKPQVSIA